MAGILPLVVVALVAEPAVLGRPEDVLWIVGERHGVEPERDPGIAREHRQSAAEVPWLCRRNDHDLSGLAHCDEREVAVHIRHRRFGQARLDVDVGAINGRTSQVVDHGAANRGAGGALRGWQLEKNHPGERAGNGAENDIAYCRSGRSNHAREFRRFWAPRL